MNIEALDHVQLAMPAGQEDLARGFYCAVLGFAETPKPPNLAKRGGLWFEHRGLKIHLGVEPGFRAARKAHPAFVITGLEQLIALCNERGFRVVRDEAACGYSRAYVHDPFDNPIEFMERNGS